MTSSFDWSRREFLLATGLAGLARPAHAAAETTPFPVELRKPGPYEALRRYIPPGSDEYAVEKHAMDIEAMLAALPAARNIPLADDFLGTSPNPVRLRAVSAQIAEAEYDSSDADFKGGLLRWLDSIGDVRRLQFFVLPHNRVRFEASSLSGGRPSYRVGHWDMEWRDGKLVRFRPLDETHTNRSETMFTDCSEQLLGGSAAWREQLLRGIPYWRSRLDSASGIDIYGSNGIAAADIDNDGWDEIYISQPGGLPNRLFKRRGDGTYKEIAAEAGLDLLDDTSCSLFVDFRNSGWQDAIVLRPRGPLYFMNEGHGRFRLLPDAFRFASAVQGTFTGMSAADYDRDGRVDLFLCTYVYFQSEDRFRYPVPYHDAQNGPPNFLMRNRLERDGIGFFEDVTKASGIDHNNSRYSFAAAWCDYDGSGWPSLYVANDFGRNNLYRNQRGRFRDAAAEAGVEDIGPGMCVSWFDYDGDGLTDLYIANMWTPGGQRVTSDAAFRPALAEGGTDAYRRHTKGDSLYRNRGDGTFEEIADAGGAAVGRWAWGAEGIDFDNDGTPEILIAAGMLTNSRPEDMMSFFWRQVVAKSPATASVAPDYEAGWDSLNQYIREDYSWNGREPNLFYVRAGGRFRDCSGISGIDYTDDSRTFAVTDFDGDGSLDIFLKSRLGPQVRALRNRCGIGRNAIAFSLRGTRSSRDAIGAIVEVQHGNRRTRKALQAGSGYLSQHTKRLHFGLGNEKVAARVSVRWPSGEEQTFEPLEAGFVYDIVEGSEQWTRKPFLPPVQSGAGAPVTGDNSVRMAPAWLLEPVPLPDKRRGPGFVLLTAGGDVVPAGVPVEVIDLRKAGGDVAASYTIFRRYLFDWRAPLTAPLLILIDSAGQAHKLYPEIPPAEELRRDLAALVGPDRDRLALPFTGRYVSRPSRSYYKLGAAFAGAGYADQALPYLKAAVAQWDGNFKAWLALGQVHLEGKRLGAAKESLERALSLNPKSPEVWNNLGGVAIEEGRNDEALRCFDRMLSIAPDSIYGLTNAALASSRLGRAAEAERLYRRVLEIAPADADIADRLGLLVARQGRLEDAVLLFKQALSHDRQHASAINNLGVAYVQAGKTDDAVATFEYGVQVAPRHDMIALNLARLYVTLGRRERARDMLRALLERVPDHAAARRALEQLQEP